MKIRDRIKSLRRVRAGDLLPNPKNWRVHPEAQQNALRGILAEVGIADALLVRETPDGLMLIDGHLRADVDADTKWPVLVLDVTEAEADKLLATVDPLAAMAEADPAKLDALLRDLDTGSEALQSMLAELASDAGLYETEQAGKKPEATTENYADRTIKRITLFFSLEEYDSTVGRLDAVCQSEGVETHTEAFLKLLERYEAD